MSLVSHVSPRIDPKSGGKGRNSRLLARIAVDLKRGHERFETGSRADYISENVVVFESTGDEPNHVRERRFVTPAASPSIIWSGNRAEGWVTGVGVETTGTDRRTGSLIESREGARAASTVRLLGPAPLVSTDYHEPPHPFVSTGTTLEGVGGRGYSSMETVKYK